MMRETLNLPPFPLLTFDVGWFAHITLNSWRGFRENPDCWSTARMEKESDGRVWLYVNPADDKKAPPTPEQITAYQFLIDNEEAVYQSILQGLYEDYPSRRESYGEGADEWECMPELTHPDEFKNIIGLSTVNILTTAREKCAYIRFDLEAAWDPEHGFNITMYKDRVVKVGDTGAEEYHAQDDAKLGS